MRRNLKSQQGVAEEKMFGGIGFLVNGNTACASHKQELIVRLGGDEFERALLQPHVRIFDMSGKPMKGWILVSSDGYVSDKSLQGWIKKGVAFAGSLSPE
jgi:hypothetical protein